jgi:uncharacterized membrane protein YbhN (UPF0104 family)
MTSTQSRKSGISLAWNLSKIVLALALLIYVLSKAELTSLISALKNVSVFWLIVSGMLYFLLTLLKALQYHVLMQDELTYAQILNVIVWQNAVSNFFLAGAGILTYITTTRLEHDLKISRSVTIFLLTKVGDLTAIWLALLISSSLIWSQISILHVPLLVLLTGIGIVIAGFFLTVLFRQRFVSTLDKVLSWMGVSQMTFIEKGMSHLQGLATTKQDKVLKLSGMLLFYSFVYLAVTIIWTYTNLAIFHLQLAILPVIFVSVLMQLVSYFPVAVFGGLGITETSALYFWSFFNVSQDVLAPALIGIRVVFYLFNVIPLIYLPVYSTFLKPKEQVHNEQ